MTPEFSARQTSVNSSKLERLTNRPSNVVADFASLVGWNGLSGQLANLDVGGAINVLILSIAAQNGIEPIRMRKWLPCLRNETLLLLARDLNNWNYTGPEEYEMAFNSKLYGSESKVRGELAALLGISLADTASVLCYHSESDVECLTKEQLESSGRAPLFVIRATTLAERIKSVCLGQLFVASLRADVWA